MFVGVLRLRFSIPGSRSLKDRRSVVRSFKERTQSRFRVAAAEVGDVQDPRTATLGIACVANEAAHCDEVLGHVARMANSLRDAILTDRALEIVSFGEGGRGVQGGIEQALHGSPLYDERDEEDEDEEQGDEHDQHEEEP
jgi:uncharacterized protein YlxP (DUF503 family)